MIFNIHQVVNTPKGKGEVTYIEDGYIEVTVNGVEMSFDAPFNGVTEYTGPKPITPENFKISNRFDDIEIPFLMEQLARLQHVQISYAVTVLGGTADPWEELSQEQKLNFVAIAMGFGTADKAAEKIRNQEL